MPEQQGVSIAHGDYRFGNCLTDVEHGRIAAVLDWELCTLGDPLADVGYLGVVLVRRRSSEPGRSNDPTSAGGFPTYDELLERYASRTGRDVSGIDYYVAFSLLAAGRHQRGRVRPLPARRDGRPGRRHRAVEARRRRSSPSGRWQALRELG